MTKKIFHSIFIAVLSVLVMTFLFITGYMYNYLDKLQINELHDELNLAAVATEALGPSYLKSLQAENYRLTLVDTDGTVLYDTKIDFKKMENHKDREEINEALISGNGHSTRKSTTFTEKTLYEATRLEDGTVLRISVSHMTSLRLLAGMLLPLLLICLLATCFSLFLAQRMTKHIIEPFNTLDLEHPLRNNAYEELSPILHRINDLHEQVNRQIQELQWRTKNFNQITQHMKEGLILLDQHNNILSINTAAKALFGTTNTCIGKDFLTVNRNTHLQKALQTAIEKGHGEIQLHHDGKIYQIDLSRTESENNTFGVVLLSFDITERVNAENNRREFTANVSHELKTPLQSIIGSAELLQGHFVKTEDIPHFIERIHDEANRLVVLIDDIIRLSQLEEKHELPFEAIDLAALTEEVFRVLEDAATKKEITLSLSGEATIFGVRRLIFEMLYNLCDNAIKYNKEKSAVDVQLTNTPQKVTITVADTGIGIPNDDKGRIFERFYRVDKSHSKQSGGNGLGLSIVKHVVQCHNGTIQLESTENVGTTISIALPLEPVK